MSVHLSDGTLHGDGEDPNDGKNYVDGIVTSQTQTLSSYNESL